MAYTPPVNNAVNFDFLVPYTAPVNNVVNFGFTDSLTGSVDVSITMTGGLIQDGALRGHSDLSITMTGDLTVGTNSFSKMFLLF